MPIGQSVVAAFHSLIFDCRYYCVACALLAFFFGIAQDFRKKKSRPLHSHLGKAIAGGAVPLALVLICGAFDPTILSKVPGLEVPILLGGIALLCLSFKQAVRPN
jgi:hypothetical protein